MSALRRFLVDFDAPPEPLRDAEPPPAPPLVDPVGEAVGLALAEAERAHAAAVAALAAAHAAEGVAARARWAAEEGTRLAEGFRGAVDLLGAAIGDAAAAALEPLLGEAARVLAVDGLRDAVADLLLGGPGGGIAVSGPPDLLDALRRALAAAGVGADAVCFAPGEAAEVTVMAGDSRIESRLGAFAGALRRRLGQTESETAA